MLRKGFVALLLIAVVVFAFSGLAAAEGVSVIVNGNAVAFDTPPVIENGTTFVPLRAVGEALNVQVGWSAADRTVIVRTNDYDTDLPLEAPEQQTEGLSLEINGKVIETDKIMLENGRVLVPLRIISENLGATVSFDKETLTVTIDFAASAAKSEADSQAVEILTASDAVMFTVPAYSAKMDGKIGMLFNFNDSFSMGDLFSAEDLAEMKAEIDGMKLNMGLNADMYYRNPLEIYMKMKMDLSGSSEALLEDADLAGLGLDNIEFYLSGEKVYLKMAGSEWEENDAPIDISMFNPNTLTELSGKISNHAKYIRSEQINGQSYHVIEITVDKSSLIDIMDEVMGIMGVGGVMDMDLSQLGLSDLNDVIDSLNMQCTYYINSDDMTLYKGSVKMAAKMNVMFMVMDMNMDMSISYDYANTGEMPNI